MRGLFLTIFPAQRRLERLALLSIVVSAAGLFLLSLERGSWSNVAGDEGTFLAMAESLARDGDLAFDERDHGRLEGAAPPRRALILQRAGGRIAYSKPVVFPIAAAPFYGLLGRSGVVALNVLLLGGSCWLFWRAARRRRERGQWAFTVATFAAAGALLPQVVWAMGDVLQFALALAGAVLVLDRRPAGRWSPGVGGLLLGLLIVMRLPNALLVAAVLAAAWLSSRRPARLAAAAAVVGILVGLLSNLALIGSISPYRAERATFNRATGYPAGAQAEQALEQFVVGRATQTLAARPTLQPRNSAYSALYFLAGRHTGLLLYFPASLLLFGAALRAGDASSRVLLAGATALALFYLVWMPHNYFGGASFVGNRYFLPAYALLLPALRKPLGKRSLLAVWTVSGLVFLSAWSSVAAERGRPFSSQSHAYAGLFRFFPYESTALAIEDREDRYFSDEFFRFVDRNARVSDLGFHLLGGAAPAEVLLATGRPSGVLRFLAVADAPGAAVTYRDWRGVQRFELPEHPGGARGLIEVVAAPAWRRHPFWWAEETLRAHSLRLAVDGDVGDVQLRYLGPYRLVPKFFGYETLEVDVPEVIGGGERPPVAVGLANRGRRPWSSAADVPVHLVWRVEEAAGGEIATGFVTLAGTVERHQETRVEALPEWPSRPGRFRIELDLALAGAVRFEEWIGEPIASRVVEVRPGS